MQQHTKHTTGGRSGQEVISQQSQSRKAWQLLRRTAIKPLQQPCKYTRRRGGQVIPVVATLVAWMVWQPIIQSYHAQRTITAGAH